MPDKVYVYSTLSSDQLYTSYRLPIDKGALSAVDKKIFVKGGANLSSGSHPHFITPAGVRTEISEDDFRHLMGEITDPQNPDFLNSGNHDFKRHMRGGHISVRIERADPNEVAKEGMEARDKSAPLTPNSAEFQNPNGPQVQTEKPEKSVIASLSERIRGMIG